MVHKVRMPKFDANVTEGTIARWLASPGQKVSVGQPIAEILTDKAEFELEAEQAGVLRSLLAPDKSVVPAGYVIALISESESEPLPDVEAENAELMRRYQQELIAGPEPEQARAQQGQSVMSQGAVRATPAARQLARQYGLSVEAIAARLGRTVRLEDVQAEIARKRPEVGQ